MKQQIENIIKKNLPEEKKLIENRMGDYYYYEDEDWKGFNQALSQINTSLIADEVLKLVVEKIEELRKTKTFPRQRIHLQDHSVEYLERLSDADINYNQSIEDLLSTLSPNNENE